MNDGPLDFALLDSVRLGAFAIAVVATAILGISWAIQRRRTGRMVHEAIARALRNEMRGQLDLAEAELRRLQQELRSDPRPLIALGDLYQTQSRTGDAITAYHQAALAERRPWRILHPLPQTLGLVMGCLGIAVMLVGIFPQPSTPVQAAPEHRSASFLAATQLPAPTAASQAVMTPAVEPRPSVTPVPRPTLTVTPTIVPPGAESANSLVRGNDAEPPDYGPTTASIVARGPIPARSGVSADPNTLRLLRQYTPGSSVWLWVDSQAPPPGILAVQVMSVEPVTLQYAVTLLLERPADGVIVARVLGEPGQEIAPGNYTVNVLVDGKVWDRIPITVTSA